MKKVLSAYPLSYFLFLSICMVSACVFKTDSNNITASTAQERPNIKRELTTILFSENAADTPAVVNYKILFNIKDSTNGSISFIDFNQQDSSKKDITLTPERIDELDDYRVELAKIPDNWVVRPGKMICTEKTNALIQMIFNTGDTIHYIINASARCDPKLFFTWHKVDSMRQILNKMTQ